MLLTLAGAALAACRPPTQDELAGPTGFHQATTSPSATADPDGTDPGTSDSAEALPPADPSTSGAPEPGIVVAQGSGLSREQVVARYGAQRPTAWGLDLPGVTTRMPTTDRVLALTFDACGGPHGSGYDGALIGTLRRLHVPATLFLNSRWIDANPGPFAELAADPLFLIGNHGTEHRPLSVTGRAAYKIPGTRDVGEVYDEITGNRDKLTRLLGRTPQFFRTGTAFCDDVALRVVGDTGQRMVNFEVNGDAGATRPPDQVTRALLTSRPGSIVICHMNQPGSGTAAGIGAAAPKLTGAGFRFVHLSDYLS